MALTPFKHQGITQTYLRKVVIRAWRLVKSEAISLEMGHLITSEGAFLSQAMEQS